MNRAAGTSARVMAVAPVRRISIIISTLNEASQLGHCLPVQLPEEVCEVIVCDGGSADATCEIARQRGWRVLAAPRGRASQMNAGAAAATGEVLLFLHADTRLPQNFPLHIAEVLARPGVVAGAFRLAIDSPRTGLRMVEQLANFRSQVLQMPFGDQAIFVTAEAFRAVGGYPEQPLMEDVELIRRLRRLKGLRSSGKASRVGLASAAVLTSARRWQRRGVLRTSFGNLACQAAYFCGVSPRRIHRWYYGSPPPGLPEGGQSRT